MDGTIQVPGGNALKKEMSMDQLEAAPPPPKFNKMVVGGDKKDTLMLPIAVVKEWQFHATFGSDFKAWMDANCERFTVVDDAIPEPLPTPGGKRGASGDLPGTPSPKKNALKVGPDSIIEVTSIKTALLAECIMQGKDQPTIQVRHSHALYLVNKSTTLETTSPQHAFVAAFGKGGFKLQKPPAADAPPAATLLVDFNLKNSDDKVVFQNVVRTLGEVVGDQKATKPDTQVCYHKLEPDDVDPKKFKLTQTHKIAFVPVCEATDATTNNFASKESPEYWSNDVTTILWAVRWSAKGLMPVRPEVHLKAALVLQPGRACHLASV